MRRSRSCGWCRRSSRWKGAGGLGGAAGRPHRASLKGGKACAELRLYPRTAAADAAGGGRPRPGDAAPRPSPPGGHIGTCPGTPPGNRTSCRAAGTYPRGTSPASPRLSRLPAGITPQASSGGLGGLLGQLGMPGGMGELLGAQGGQRPDDADDAPDAAQHSGELFPRADRRPLLADDGVAGSSIFCNG